MQQDLTAGAVPAQLIKFSFPLFLANLLQSLYGMVDMAVVGRFVGGAGLAAVSSASMMGFIINAICMGVTMGGSVMVAQCQGARDLEGRRKSVEALFMVSLLAALAVTAAGLQCFPAVFEMMSVPAQALPHAEAYMRVVCLGTVFVFGYNAVCSVMRGLGDAKSPLLYVALATAVNIVLDFILAGGCGMGTAGAALATIVSQGVSFAAAFWHLRQRSGLWTDARPYCFPVDRRKCGTVLKIGLPTAVQMAVINLSYLVVTGMFNRYGVTIAAAAGIGLKVNTFAAMPCWAIGQAATTMAGQNMGAGKTERAAGTARAGVGLSLAASAVTAVLVQIFARPLLSLFSGDEEILQQGVLYLRICCSVNSLVYAAMYVLNAFATGVGAATMAMLNAMLHSIVMRLALSWLLGTVWGLGYRGLYWAEMLSPLLSLLVGLLFFYRGGWRKCHLTGNSFTGEGGG